MKSSITDQNFITWIQEIRRHIHQHPELGFQEYETARFIGEKLKELDIQFQTGIAKTGIIATLGQQDPGVPCIALRADMDGLPVEEMTGLPFSSQKKGIMHACGHDGHVAMLLGAAALLKKETFNGQVILIFQPAEEGEGGAKQIINEGVLDNVDAIFAGHIDRHFDVNQISIEPGLISAYTDEFHIKIQGKGGHAAKPHETIDSIVVASLLVMSIQTLVSREVNPTHPSVVTVGKIQGGTASNVIADQAFLQGTIRSTHPEVRQEIITGLERMVKAMESLYHASTDITIKEGYPPVVNHAVAARLAQEVAAKVVGSDGVMPQPNPSMGGEDFSFYLKKVPGCLVRFGAKRQDLGDIPAHSPRFDFDEGVLPVGATFLAQTALAAIEHIDELRINNVKE